MSARSITTVSIDSNLLSLAKEKNINISNATENALKALLNLGNNERLNALLAKKTELLEMVQSTNVQIEALMTATIKTQYSINRLRAHPMYYEYRRQAQDAKDNGEYELFCTGIAKKLDIDPALVLVDFKGSLK